MESGSPFIPSPVCAVQSGNALAVCLLYTQSQTVLETWYRHDSLMRIIVSKVEPQVKMCSNKAVSVFDKLLAALLPDGLRLSDQRVWQLGH